MDHSQVKKYFEDYIKKYSPYKDSRLYEALLDYLRDNFTKNLYNDIPKDLKNLYEDNYIDVGIYDQLLKGIGVPENILKKLPMQDKVLFFNNLTDFYRYRGNIDFFKNVTKLFHRALFDVYELYIDYDETLEDWVFKPYLIVKNKESSSVEVEIPNIMYDNVYHNIPSLLINKTQLNHYRENNNIVLPIKSNIVLLDTSFGYEASGLVSLIVSTFVSEYQYLIFDLYFMDNVFSVTLKEFYLIWYYILLRNFESTTIGGHELQSILEYDPTANPYTLHDIENLVEEYNNLENAYEARQFYEEHIERIFKNRSYSVSTDWRSVEPLINVSVFKYINNRLEQNPDDSSLVYNEILNEMLDSFLLYVAQSDDNLFVKYSENFVNSLTNLILDPKRTNPYILLNNFKPFHTELLTKYRDFIFSESKFDMVTPDNEYRFLFELQKADIYDVIDYKNFNFNFKNYTSNFYVDACNFLQILKHLLSLNIDNKFSFDQINENIELIELIDHIKNYTDIYKLSTNQFIDVLKCLTVGDYKNLFEFGEDFIFKPVIFESLNLLYLVKFKFGLEFFNVDELNLDFEYIIKLKHEDLINFIDYIQKHHFKYRNYHDSFDFIYGDFKFSDEKTEFDVMEISYADDDYVKLDYAHNHDTENLHLAYVSDSYIKDYYFPKRIDGMNAPFVRAENLPYLTSIGVGGLSVGDKIYNENDDPKYARQIMAFNYQHKKIILDSLYTGPTKRGNLKKLTSFKESFSGDIKYLDQSKLKFTETFEIIQE